MGGKLGHALGWPRGKQLESITDEQMIEALIATKVPRIFAESEVTVDGIDWTHEEITTLGDISFAVPVLAFDDGRHWGSKPHENPIPATLLFVPGALLGSPQRPVDAAECVRDEKIYRQGYQALYERRLLPPLLYAQQQVARRGRKALVTIPGIGCNNFCGRFRGHVGHELELAIENILQKYGHKLPDIKTVFFDPNRECTNRRESIHNINYMVRPLALNKDHKTQLCTPQAYAEPGDDFSDCDLFSCVGWDHVSWPGNDFFVGSRATDDGVKAAATSSMTSITGYQGYYDPRKESYMPPPPFRCWEELVEHHNIKLNAAGRIQILG